MKIGRNDPCHCGSSKKYKKCCINKPQSTVRKPEVKMDNKANPIFIQYNSFDLLQIVAGLTLLPDNHGKYVRMEELSLRVVQNYNDKPELVSNEQFRTLLTNEYPSHHLEDLPVNMFTDLITFFGGDYLIFLQNLVILSHLCRDNVNHACRLKMSIVCRAK